MHDYQSLYKYDSNFCWHIYVNLHGVTHTCLYKMASDAEYASGWKYFRCFTILNEVEWILLTENYT